MNLRNVEFVIQISYFNVKVVSGFLKYKKDKQTSEFILLSELTVF